MSQPRRALVVDDSKVMRRIIVKIVKSLGFDAIEAGDGRDAIAVLEDALYDGPIDLVLTDWNMPDVDGLQLIRWLRDDPRLDGLPVVMITSESELGRVEEALAAGADEYLMKPFDQAALEDKLALLGLLGSEPVT